MSHPLKTKLIHEGGYAAEVDVHLIEDETGWAPYLCLEDAQKLDKVRQFLRQGKIDLACNFARVYLLQPVLKN
mgnify:CR=1 FL=1